MGILGGGGGGGGGGVGLGGGGGGGLVGGGGGLCVFSCAAILSAFGAIASLYDFDIGSESAFFATTGLGALCFAKCQYLRLAQEKSRIHRKTGSVTFRDDPLQNYGWTPADAQQYDNGGGRRKRQIAPEHDFQLDMKSHHITKNDLKIDNESSFPFPNPNGID